MTFFDDLIAEMTTYQRTYTPDPLQSRARGVNDQLKTVAVSQDTLTGYMTRFYQDDGSPTVDLYQDEVDPYCFDEDIQHLHSHKVGNYLLPYLWQHQPHEIIGGVTDLQRDSKGVSYEVKLIHGVQRASECYALAQAGLLGTSYGYDVLQSQLTPTRHRRLLKCKLHEISAVTFPALVEVGRVTAKTQDYALSEMKARGDLVFEKLYRAAPIDPMVLLDRRFYRTMEKLKPARRYFS